VNNATKDNKLNSRYKKAWFSSMQRILILYEILSMFYPASILSFECPEYDDQNNLLILNLSNCY